MKKIKHNGFVLILVIALIAVIGLEMFVLADGSNTMLFQSEAAYLRACERNLVASGLAWAKRNIKDESKISGKTIELDITNMNIRSSILSITISAPADKEKEIQVNVSCSRARHTRSSTSKFKIGL